MQNIVYLNGQLIPAKDAKISVFDRGFLFADAIYEVIPIYNGICFMLNEHLARLDKSLQATHLTIPQTKQELIKILEDLYQAQKPDPKRPYFIYLQISRGSDGYNRRHHYPDDMSPTIFASCQPFTEKTDPQITQGMSAISIPDLRRERCHIKATGLQTNALAFQMAKQKNCDEAILIKNGIVTEATSSNLFIVENNTLITPPATDHILHGITRGLIIDLAEQHSIPCSEKTITEKELLNADEIFITGSKKGIWPIVTLNDQPIKNGQPGPITLQLLSVYREFLQDHTSIK